MKKITIPLLFAGIIALHACNSASNDSVTKADSTNNSKDTVASLSNQQDSSTMKTGINSDVADFAVKAANAGMTEVKLGSYATKSSSDKTIKDYAAMLVKDHTKANDELKALAAAKNITLPDSVSNDNKSMIDDLMKKTGKDFDKAYMNQMVKDHKDAVDLFQKASANLADTAIKSFATKTLPALQEHLQSAQSIVKSHNF